MNTDDMTPLIATAAQMEKVRAALTMAEARAAALESAIRWVLYDAHYRAPEQFHGLWLKVWAPHLYSAVTPRPKAQEETSATDEPSSDGKYDRRTRT